MKRKYNIIKRKYSQDILNLHKEFIIIKWFFFALYQDRLIKQSFIISMVFVQIR